MNLARWIALIFLIVCLIYGYTAFFVMDAQLPPFMKRNPMWPSTFPKWLAGLGVVSALSVLITAKEDPVKQDDIDYRRLREYKLGQVVLLIGLMVAYALTLHSLGFIASTTLFLMLSAMVLGERKLHVLVPVAILATLFVWYLVQQVLGIFLRPWPWFIH